MKIPAFAHLLLFLTAVAHANVKNLYTQHCQICHGDKGQGGLGSSLIDRKWEHGESDAEQARVIAEGLPELGMQGFGELLTEKEIRSGYLYAGAGTESRSS